MLVLVLVLVLVLALVKVLVLALVQVLVLVLARLEGRHRGRMACSVWPWVVRMEGGRPSLTGRWIINKQ